MSFFLCNYFLFNDKEYQSIFSHSTIRKIFSLLKSQYIDSECRLNVLKVARSLGEHICIDVILQYQNFQQLKNNFHSAIGLQDGRYFEPGLIFFFKLFFIILIIVY